MKKVTRSPTIFMLVASGIILLLFLLLQPLQVIKFQEYLAVLFPKGWVGAQQLDLLLIIQVVMLIIVIPVFIFTFIFSWKYRADNPNGKYEPHLTDNLLAEIIWWGLPLVLTVGICVLTWIRTHELDPFKSLPPEVSDKKEMTIQVVAMQWKWLFIYPEEKIATLNHLQIPVDRPIRFEITADAPMNSFWIPDLGGQIYAMPRMTTVLYLVANETGNFRGSSANISGEGFSSMHFMTKASKEEEYKKWVEEAKHSTLALTNEVYEKLSLPSIDETKTYQLAEDNLFNFILNKFMHPPKVKISE